MIKETKKAPTIRFRGFTDDWEQRKLKELVDKYEKSVETPHDGYIRLGVRSHGKGTFHEYVEPGHELETAKMYQVAANKLIFNITFAWEHAVALTDSDDEGKLVSHRFPQFSLHDNLIPNFLKYVILDEKFHHHLYLSSPGGAGRNRVLKINEALDYSIKIPSVLEQKKIGQTLNNITNLITLHQRKLDQLKTLKKYFLQNMFPAKGEKVPRIRFKGFTGDWEQRKLGDFGAVAMCKRIFKDQTSEKGDIPFYKIGTFGGVPDAYIPRELFNEYKQMYPYPEKGDILISASGSIGRTVEYTGEDAYFQDSNIVWLRHDKSIVNLFLKYLYEVIQWAGIEGSTIKRLYNDNILTTEVMIPSVQEQEKIGAYLDSIDHLITLHQRKLDQLQTMKKFMLQNMFI